MTGERYDAAAIQARLPPLALAQQVRFAAQVASTNDEARRAADEGAPHGTVCVADVQSAGRGRGGKAWHAAAGESLLVSVLLRPPPEVQPLPCLALVAGLAVARAVDEALAGAGRPERAGVKWPNDVLVTGRKLAGVLVEAVQRAGAPAVIVGMGVNVGATELPGPLAHTATSLALLGARVDRAELLVSVLVALDAAYATFAQGGLPALLDELRARDVLRGNPVSVGELRGEACGLDASGRLRLRDANGIIHPVLSGEVTWTPR